MHASRQPGHDDGGETRTTTRELRVALTGFVIVFRFRLERR
jgi:hypothetical protein